MWWAWEGGNFPTYVRRHLPKVRLDCTEIDPGVLQVAELYFGFRTDPQLRVFIADGRDFLVQRPRDELYDAIFIDAFNGVGFAPVRMATLEFLDICRAQLRPGGVLVVNLLPTDGLVAPRLVTLGHAFPHTYVSQADALVVFARDTAGPPREDLIRRAAGLEASHGFNFPFVPLAASLAWGIADTLGRLAPRTTGVLTDSTPPPLLPILPSITRSIGRNEHCPCGSGRKFKKCHGAPR